MKRYRPALVNEETPWRNVCVPMVKASMVECETGGYIEYSPLHESALEMYEVLQRILEGGELEQYVISSEIHSLLAKARGES